MSGHRRYWTKNDSERGSATRQQGETTDPPVLISHAAPR